MYATELRILLDTLHKLSEYPVLAILAQKYTSAMRLDGRACRYIYETELHKLDLPEVSDAELNFIRTLGVKIS